MKPCPAFLLLSLERKKKGLVVHGLVAAGAVCALLLATASTAGDEQDEGADEGQGSGDDGKVGGRAVLALALGLGVVDLGQEEAKGDKVNNGGDGGDDKADAGSDSGEDGDDGALVEQAEEEGNGQEDGADGVEDKDPGQALGRVSADVAVAASVDRVENGDGVVANARVGASPAEKEEVST